MICAAFKVENLAVVWNINTCDKVYTFDAGAHSLGNMSLAQFYPLNPNYLLVSGD